MTLDDHIKQLVAYEVQKLLPAVLPQPKKVNKLAIHINELSNITGLSIDALKGRRKRGKLSLINDGNELLCSIKEVQRFCKTLGLEYKPE